MAAARTSRDRLLALAERRSHFTTRDATGAGIHKRWLRRLLDEGLLERIGHGVYRSATPPETADETLFDACAAVPNGIVCLASALAYHGLSTINPSRVDIAVKRDEWRRHVEYPPVTFHKFRDVTTGLEKHDSSGRELRIFSSERTICDTFRLRREIGKEIAIEALQTYIRRSPRAKLNVLVATARKTGVYKVIQPYLEALV